MKKYQSSLKVLYRSKVTYEDNLNHNNYKLYLLNIIIFIIMKNKDKKLFKI